jgi:group I intron endonuclease
MDEMIKRVTGGRDISGIYKITYLKTGEAYIGKTTNIKKRWGEHCKSSLDIGTIAHSSFHTRLKRDGLWNYTFEILEEVPKDKLTEREKFYISLYGTDK